MFCILFSLGFFCIQRAFNGTNNPLTKQMVMWMSIFFLSANPLLTPFQYFVYFLSCFSGKSFTNWKMKTDADVKQYKSPQIYTCISTLVWAVFASLVCFSHQNINKVMEWAVRENRNPFSFFNVPFNFAEIQLRLKYYPFPSSPFRSVVYPSSCQDNLGVSRFGKVLKVHNNTQTQSC